MAAVEKLVFAHGPILSGKLVCLLWYQQPTTNQQQQQHGTPPRTRARSVTLMLVLVLRMRRVRSWVSHQSEHNRFQTSGWFQNLASRLASFPWLLSKTCWRYFDIASFSTVEGDLRVWLALPTLSWTFVLIFGVIGGDLLGLAEMLGKVFPKGACSCHVCANTHVDWLDFLEKLRLNLLCFDLLLL